MKNRRVCPKCGGTDILRVEGKAGAYGSGNNIMTGMTIFSAVLVHRYVCCDCGYSEEWIDNRYNKIISIALGRTFSWMDLVCYAVGCVAAYFLDRLIQKT